MKILGQSRFKMRKNQSDFSIKRDFSSLRGERNSNVRKYIKNDVIPRNEVWRAILDEPLLGLMLFRQSNTVRFCFNYLTSKTQCMSEHFLLMCKRKAHEPFEARHPTAAAQARTRRLFSPRSAHASEAFALHENYSGCVCPAASRFA